MTRDDILEIVRQETVDILGIEPDDTIDDSKTFADYDAVSIDIVSIVSGSMRRLEITIPNEKLFAIQNIGELIDLFEQAYRAQKS